MLVAAIIAIPLRANIPRPCSRRLHQPHLVPPYILAYNVGGLVTGGAPLVMPPDTRWNWEDHALPCPLAWIASMGDTFPRRPAIQSTFAAAGLRVTMIAWRVVVTVAWRKRHARRAKAAR
jgi:uncharacterized protein (DUF2062 family)